MGIAITIILPVYNAVESIKTCIESALNQEFKDIEILCIDAGSNDGTYEILKEYSKRDDRVRVINSAKKSYGYQMNLGLSEACGEYIGILEADDSIAPEMYDRLYEIARSTRADVIKSDYYEVQAGITGENNISTRMIIPDCSLYGKILSPEKQSEYIYPDAIATWSGIYRKTFLLENKIKYNESPGASFQDIGFWAQTNYYAQSIVFLNESLYQYRIDNPDSSTFQKNKAFCICDEFELITNIFTKGINQERKRLLDRLCWVFYRKYKRNIERVREEDLETFYSRFSKDFSFWNDRIGIGNDDFYPEEREELELIIKDPISYLSDIKRIRSDYLKHILSYDKVYIYGAGRIGKKLAEIFGKRIESFLVTEPCKDSEFCGIPISPISADTSDNRIPIIIASKRSDYRHNMYLRATSEGFLSVEMIPYGAFEW